PDRSAADRCGPLISNLLLPTCASLLPVVRAVVQPHADRRIPRRRLEGPRWQLSSATRRPLAGSKPAPGALRAKTNSLHRCHVRSRLLYRSIHFPFSEARRKTAMRTIVLTTTAAIALGLAHGSSVYSQQPAKPTQATFLINGLHCPPCTSTVQNSLTRVKGVK